MTSQLFHLIARRSFQLGAVAALAASAALANAPATSLYPQIRPVDLGVQSLPDPQAVIDAARLDGHVGYVVRDGATGQVLEEHNGDLALPPASVAKALTAAYALSAFGVEHRFHTQIIATGPVVDGVVQGDLVLVGGGDPTLDTDGLNTLAAQLRTAGIQGVTGDLKIWGGALPFSRLIDADQPDHVGYNPSLSGLNVNFNRVYFEWKRAGSDYSVTMQGRSENLRPDVTMARMSIQSRAVPIYTYSETDRYDSWTVARGALGNSGGRWLPVRKPELYAGQILRKVAAAQGVRLPDPVVIDAPLSGTVVADVSSPPMRTILKDMLKYSNNLTAEIVGMAATKAMTGNAQPTVASAQAMCAWLITQSALGSCDLVDHSGLGGDSRISARDMSQALHHFKSRLPLKPILKEFALLDANRQVIKDHPLAVHAKTGTLNFVSGLAGHVTLPDGTDLDFAIFSGDLDRRAQLPVSQRERPDGGAAWNRRAKTLQQTLIERWGVLADAGWPDDARQSGG